MNYLLSTRRFQLLAAVSLALVILPAVEAEPRCPGNIASVTPRLVQHALIVIPVKINQAGPFDFMVDTGSQVTVIDPSLAAELNLKAQGRVGLVSVANFAGFHSRSGYLEAGSHVVANLSPWSRTFGRFRQPILGFGSSRREFPRALRPVRRLWAQIALSRRDQRDAR